MKKRTRKKPPSSLKPKHSNLDACLLLCIFLEKLKVIKLKFNRNEFWDPIPPNGIELGLMSNKDYYTAEPYGNH